MSPVWSRSTRVILLHAHPRRNTGANPQHTPCNVNLDLIFMLLENGAPEA